MLEDKLIMLLEDDLIDVMTMKISNELLVKENGEGGLEYLNHCTELPGLIFLDLNMPKMNGLEFLEAIRLNEKWSQIPLVVLTTSKNMLDKLAAFGVGVSGYMIKPVDFAEFKEMIKTIKKYWDLSEYSY
jgi:CheY-like chemotaxis protein